MEYPLTVLEQQIIGVVLEFANLRQIESKDQVHALFMPLAQATRSPIFKVIGERDIGAFVDDRSQLVEWLSKIGRPRISREDRENIWGNLREVLKETVRGEVTWTLTDAGTLSCTVAPRLNGVRACIAFAAALLLDRAHGSHRWVKRCALDECENWFFDWRPSGRPRKFCCDLHAARFRQIKFAKKRRGKKR